MATDNQILQQILEAIRGNNNNLGGGAPDNTDRTQDSTLADLAANNRLTQQQQAALDERFKVVSGLRKEYQQLDSILANINDKMTLEGKLTEKASDELVKKIELMRTQGAYSEDRARVLKELAENAKTSKEAMRELMQELKFDEEGRKNWDKLVESIEKFGDKVKESLGVSADIFKELAFEADRVGKQFGASTGFSNDFRDSMLEINKAAIDSGVSMADASAALSGMASNLSSFDPLAKKSNETLATQIALLGKLGVDANSAAKSIDFLERSMNMSRDAAANLTMELATFADGMGVMSGKMMSDFQAVSGTLAMQGKDMIKTFKNIAAQAKATGIEVSQLVTIAQRFNTFSDAADNVAKLNAVLGTQMSTIELMGMRQDERIDHLRDQVQMTVGDFNDLDMYTQQFIANAMGFKDVGEAGRFLNMSAQEQDEYRLRAEESAKTQEEIAKITQDFIPIMERLKLSMAKAALAMKPLIDVFMLFFDGIFALDEILGNKLLPTLAMSLLLYSGLMAAIGMYKVYAGAAAFIQSLEIAWLSLNKAMGYVGVAAVLLALLFTSDIPDGIKILIPGVLMLGLAFKFLTGKMRVVGMLFGLLVSIFGLSINPLFINAFAHMAVGVALLAVAFQFVSTKAMIAAVVLGLLFGAFAFFFAEMSGAGENLLSLSLGFVALGAALALVGLMFANPAVMYGAAIFTGLMLGLAAAVALMGTGIEKMGSGFEKMVESLKSVKGIMAELDGVVTNSFIAVTQEGGATRAVIANGDGLSGILAGNIKVDVNIPKIQSPNISVKVLLDGKELESIVEKVVGKAG